MGIVNLTKGGLRCEIVKFTMLAPLSREIKAEHIVTEHDNPADWRRFARPSIEPSKRSDYTVAAIWSRTARDTALQ
ncbi:hypothetical protein [Rhizobium leguminosarum]|jgi:IS5 family transposase|uniref:hypothetical protein n=1 Tax=Rhizobium leguminosarum TaxID=384 RepID=UPI001FDFAED1|nr:hypothetical protein [Rhizobium leguminosarum]